MKTVKTALQQLVKEMEFTGKLHITSWMIEDFLEGHCTEGEIDLFNQMWLDYRMPWEITREELLDVIEAL